MGIIKPEWVDDASTSECLRCNLQFSFIRRRHHCRACGLIFCSACCSKLKQLSFLPKPERICDLCWSELETQFKTKPEGILCLTPKGKNNRVKFEDGTPAVRQQFNGQVSLPKAPLIKRQRLKLLEDNPDNAVTLCYPPVGNSDTPKEVALSIAAEKLSIPENEVVFNLTDNFSCKVSKSGPYWVILTQGIGRYLLQKDYLVKIPAGLETLPSRHVFTWILQLWLFSKNQGVVIDSFCYQKFKISDQNFGYKGCIWFPEDDKTLSAYFLDDFKLNWLKEKIESLGSKFFPHCLLH